VTPRIILAMVELRLRRVFKDPLGWLWLIVMPMVFSLLMSSLMGDWSQSGTVTKPSFRVYAAADDAAVDALLAPLVDNDHFMLVRPDSAVSRETARQLVEESRITSALFIPAGFADSLASGRSVELALFYDSDRLSSQTVRTELDRSLLKINTRFGARTLVADPGRASGPLPSDKSAAFDEARFLTEWENPRVTLEATTLGRIETGPKVPLTQASQHVAPAYVIFFMLMFLLMSAKDLVAERRDQTLSRLMASRATAFDLVTGFFVGGMILGLVQASILLLLNSLVFGLDYGDSWVGLALSVVLFAGVCSSGSILLGCLARSGAQADGLGTAVTLVLAALGGLWWPLEIVPQFMQDLGHSLPTGQIITIFHDMIGRGAGLADLGHLLTGLTVWFVVLFVLAVWRLRRLVSV